MRRLRKLNKEAGTMASFRTRFTGFCNPVFRMIPMLLLAFAVAPCWLNADVVTDWNKIMLQAVLTAKTSPVVSTRVTAILETAVFDAVNGIERRYTPIHVDFAAPAGASQRAAAVQAAYATLVVLYPSQKATFDAALQSSLMSIAADPAVDNSVSIALGRQWGQTVANDIMAWRATDGFTPPPPPFLGGLAIGEWRPTPPDYSPGAVPQLAHVTPWAMTSPSQFRPGGPPALTSDLYATVFNEVKTMGAAFGSPRTVGQTQNAIFWTGNTPRYWNQIARTISLQRNLTLSENARLFGLLNVAMADAAIACWDAKYYYVFWRPITAIVLAGVDGNPATVADPSWIPFLETVPPGITPNFPEYPSGHSTVSAAAATILAAYFGDSTSFSIDSEKLPGVLESFTSFSQAVLTVNDARVFGGIHFRNACFDGNVLGRAAARYALNNTAVSLNGQRLGQINHNHGNGTVSGDGEISDDASL
jgi:membrane-associated phospholipid phosphatase